MPDIKRYRIEEFTPLNTIMPSKRILGRASYRIEEDCYILAGHSHISIKKGFIVDGATVPWYLRPLFPAIAKYFGATTAHDYFCARANDTGEYLVRKHGDDHFYSWLRMCGTNKNRAKAMAWGVKRYGKYLLASGKLK